MRGKLARFLLVATVAAAVGVVFPQPASAVGCDNQVGPISYGDDVKPVDICLNVAGVAQTEVVLVPNPDGATGGQYVCVLDVCQASAVWVDSNGPSHAGVGGLVCASPTTCVVAGASAEGTRPRVAVCYFTGLGSACIIDVRAPAITKE